MGTGNSQALIKMAKGRRHIFIVASCFLIAGYAASGYSSAVLLPARLGVLEAMGFYPLGGALSSLGVMLSLPMVGILCDRFGSKMITLWGVFVQLIIFIVIAFIHLSAPVLLLLCAFQGVGGGLYLSAPYSLITDVTVPSERPKYFGLLVMIGSVGSLVGPLFTGFLMDIGYSNLGWFSYLPFMVVAVPTIMALYPNTKSQEAKGFKFDFGGIVLLVICMSCIVLWLSVGGKMFDWFGAVSAFLLGVGLVSLVLLIRRETKQEYPSVPVGVFRNKRFTTAFLCNMLLCAYSTCAASYAIAFAQQIMQVSSAVSSTVTMPQTILRAVLSAVVGRWIGKNFSRRFRPVTIAAMLLISVAMLILCSLNANSGMMLIYLATAMGGFGTIIPQAAFTPFFQTELLPKEYRSAQSMFAFSGSGGACIFGAFAGVIMNAGMGYHEVFLLGAAFCIIALAIGIAGLRIPKSEIGST